MRAGLVLSLMHSNKQVSHLLDYLPATSSSLICLLEYTCYGTIFMLMRYEWMYIINNQILMILKMAV